jgi:ribosome maturation factor RimP
VTSVYEKERQLQQELEEQIAAGAPDVEVLAVELAGAARFCVFIDHPTGVDHALCERVTGLLQNYLDRYTIDVSSPGIERPLRTRAHFEAAVGRRVTVRTAGEIGGRTRFRGEVAEAGEERLSLRLDGGAVDIPYDAIVRGNLVDEGQ